MTGVGRSILEVVRSVCGFVVNGSGYSVVGNRNTQVQELRAGWYVEQKCMKLSRFCRVGEEAPMT